MCLSKQATQKSPQRFTLNVKVISVDIYVKVCLFYGVHVVVIVVVVFLIYLREGNKLEKWIELKLYELYTNYYISWILTLFIKLWTWNGCCFETSYGGSWNAQPSWITPTTCRWLDACWRRTTGMLTLNYLFYLFLYIIIDSDIFFYLWYINIEGTKTRNG